MPVRSALSIALKVRSKVIETFIESPCTTFGMASALKGRVKAIFSVSTRSIEARLSCFRGRCSWRTSLSKPGRATVKV